VLKQIRGEDLVPNSDAEKVRNRVLIALEQKLDHKAEKDK